MDGIAERLDASAQTLDNRCQPLAEVRRWLAERRRSSAHRVRPAPLQALEGWRLEAESGALVHRSGGFFRVEGARVARERGPVRRWDQPVVDQRGVGTLGFLIREIDGLLHFLVQAKMEPGSPGLVQLAPTLQATHSNAALLHKGRAPLFARTFLERRGRVVAARVLSELGAYFLHKRNLNIVLEIDGDVEPAHLGESGAFRWLTLGELELLAREDEVVNMCARSVLALLPVAGGAVEPRGRAPADPLAEGSAELVAWLGARAREDALTIERLRLDELAGWSFREGRLGDEEGRYLTVLGVEVAAIEREVPAWSQPLLHGPTEGVSGTLARVRGGALELLMQARVEPGSVDVALLAPTITADSGLRCPYERERSPLHGWFGDEPRGEVLVDCRQSLEGGRFWRTSHRYQVVRLREGDDVVAPRSHRWVALAELRRLLAETGCVHLEGRELLTLLGRGEAWGC